MNVADNLNQHFLSVTVSYFGPIKSVVKKSEEIIIIQDETCTVRTLTLLLADKYGEKFRNLIFHNKGSNRGVSIFVNGEDIVGIKDLDTPLFDKNEVSIFLVSQAEGG